jgi:hypothetical protein
MEETLRLETPFSLHRYRPEEGRRSLWCRYLPRSLRSSSTAAMYPRRRALVIAPKHAIFGFVSAVSACFTLIGGCGSDCRRHNHAGMLRKSRAFVPRY